MNRMVYILFLVILFSECCEDSVSPIQNKGYHWDIRTDTLNVAILLFDYQSYKFEGGALSYFEPCLDCGLDSIPMDMYFREPSDFGWVRFDHSVTGDTIFYGTIIWLGCGEIGVPKYFVPADSFKIFLFERVEAPCVVKIFPSYVSISEVQIDALWIAARHLDIVHAFNENGPFKVGYYLYPPRVGLFDPGDAKWIVFLIQ